MIIFIYKCLLFVIFFLELIHCQGNPCSLVIPIYKERDNNYYANIQVPIPDNHNNIFQLKVELSITDVDLTEQNLKDKIKFIGAVEDIMENRPLVYKLDFPPHITVTPKITNVAINNHVFCVDKPYSTTEYLRVVTANIQNTLVISTTHYGNTESTTKRYNIVITKPPKIFYTNSPSNPTSQISIYTTARNPIKPNTENNFESCRKTNAIPLIFHGTSVAKGAHPWLGAIFLRQSTKNPMFICGASLITTRTALTAAHCVQKYSTSDLYLIFGRVAINDWFDDNYQKAKVKEAIVHPDYIDHSADADIAILHFTTELEITATVKPVCLWNTDGDLRNIVSQSGLVAGWGQNETYVLSQDLQEVYLRVVSQEECLNSSTGFRDIISDRTFCAGNNNNTGPCNGDSGSGFYFYTKQGWTIRGIVSLSLRDLSGRCDNSRYTIYTDVAKHILWIYNSLGF